MIRFTARLQRFGKQGEKTGWTYLEISSRQANQLKPGVKVSFRVKGTIDGYKLEKAALLPMGKGNFIYPVKGEIRKAIGKQAGDKVAIAFEADNGKFVLSPDMMKCLRQDPEAMKFFQSLPGSHQKYFSKWIESAKTAHTKTKRLVICLTAFAKKQGYAEMLRSYRNYDI